jgi:DNA-binding transcriptional MocR family regulator
MTDALKSVAPIARESVEDRVAETLRDLIVTGRLPEGTPLVQRELAERLGVSQTPVRLGLVELQRVGLVEIGENGRASVSRLTREDFEEISAARLGLEGLAARLGAAAVGRRSSSAMRLGLRELERLGKAADVDGYLRARWTSTRPVTRPRAARVSSPRSSASSGAPSATTASSSRRRSASAAPSATTAASLRRARLVIRPPRSASSTSRCVGRST